VAILKCQAMPVAHRRFVTGRPPQLSRQVALAALQRETIAMNPQEKEGLLRSRTSDYSGPGTMAGLELIRCLNLAGAAVSGDKLSPAQSPRTARSVEVAARVERGLLQPVSAFPAATVQSLSVGNSKIHAEIPGPTGSSQFCWSKKKENWEPPVGPGISA
jgi:hypothetical protein